MNINIIQEKDTIGIDVDLTTSNYNTDTRANEVQDIKFSLTKTVYRDVGERYWITLWSPKEHLKEYLVERGQLDLDELSRNDVIKLWKAMGEIIKQDIKEN